MRWRGVAQTLRGRAGILKDAGRQYEINPRLVRGLDYYNLTVFEWVTDRLGAKGRCARAALRRLLEQVGGKPAPACGWAMGSSACSHSSPIPASILAPTCTA